MTQAQLSRVELGQAELRVGQAIELETALGFEPCDLILQSMGLETDAVKRSIAASRLSMVRRKILTEIYEDMLAHEDS